MNNDILQRLKSFSDSDMNSENEAQFTSKELQGYFDKKLKLQYAEKLADQYNLSRENGHQGSAKKKTGVTRRLLMVAAGLVLLAGVIYYFLSGNEIQTNETLMAYKAELYTPIDANVRGSLSDYQLLINNLTEAYEAKDFGKVVTAYERLQGIPIPFDMNIEQMAGVAYGSTDDYDQAIHIFNSILDMPESSYSNHSTVRYLLGLVYLLKGDKSHARDILLKIKMGDYKYREVQKLLTTI